MDESQQSLKKLAHIAFVAMCVLFVLAVLFYKERVLFADAAYIVFSILNEKHLCIQEQRYGSFITQLFPYLGQKLHFPLKAILIGYSASFSIFFLTVNALLVYFFKQYRLGILMVFYYFLFVSESFAWPGNEVHQAVGWLFLLLGGSLYMGNKKVSMAVLLPVFVLLTFLTVSTHFVVVIPLVFLWVYLIMEKDQWPFSKNTTILLSALLVVVAGTFWGIKNLMLAGASSYDSSHLHGLTHFSLQDIIDSFATPVVKKFLYRCLINYWVGIVVFLGSIISLIKKKKKLLAIWTFCCAIGYLIIMGLTYGALDGSTLLFHIESEWASISIIVASGFVFSYLPGIRYKMAACLLASILLIRLCYIIFFLPSFFYRDEAKNEILMQMRKKRITKLALYDDAHFMAMSKLYWGIPLESAMQSSINGDVPQLTFMMVNPDDKMKIEALKTQNSFYNAWFMVPCNTLNREYFCIDSTKPYQVMTYADLLK